MPFFSSAGRSLAILTAIGGVSLTAQIPVNHTPMEVVHGKPYVMVSVNGRGPFRFIIDTGTGGQALISTELAEELNLPLVGHARLKDPSGKGEQRVPIVLIQSLQVGGVEFTGVKAVQHVLACKEGTCMGALGFTLFRDCLLTLDYPNRQMRIEFGALEPDGESNVLPFRMPDGVPVATLRIGSLAVEAQIDSGGSGFSLPERLSSRIKFASDPSLLGTGRSLSTLFDVKEAKLASDVHLGQYTFAQPFVEINAAFPLANFGSWPMQNFTFTFDQRRMLMRLEASRKIFHLPTAPTALRLHNETDLKPAAMDLVPIG